ncbi:hypothetical protein SO802_018766 [Lithocarpus litseifolius]|uniref:Uncharacterized protein n=1 Tax=Lithocarpus litseifolius TaxID=425828 RepID=A0AAW2CMX3_9ROSI
MCTKNLSLTSMFENLKPQRKSLDSHRKFDSINTVPDLVPLSQIRTHGGGGGASIWISPSTDFDRQAVDNNLHDRQGFIAKRVV